VSRGAGFENADIDVGILDDPKFRAFARSTRDEGILARGVVAYLAVTTSSWGAGERVTLEQSAPLWLTGLDDLAERLVAVGLLDAEHRIPEKAWQSWYGPAVQRRDDRRFEGLVGGLMKSMNLGRPEAVLEAKRRLAADREQADGRSPPGQPRSPSGQPRLDLARSVPSSPSVPSNPSGHTEPSPHEPSESVYAVAPDLAPQRPRRTGQDAPSKIEETDLPVHLRAVTQ
jgi:hypothetical protein